MRRHVINILAAMFMAVSCTENTPAAYMLRPHEELPEEVADGTP